ncbi:RNA polymerase sigma factor [Terrimonas pollutisoli]|uniref:RNA polymerase sigma factor n=1 Tax=Terrimonas pollutisoli TaxID=3034147 RepID=UPI0023ED72BA|nr:sigma-70 family RNA polymerase sigma factor [Terrimonas sp. H1YJ31]
MRNACINTDTELLLQLQQHDEQALAILMRAHYRSLYNYASRFIQDEAVIKDAIQEVFISLWQRRESASSILSLPFYLLGAVKNKVLKTLQRDNRRSEALVADVQYEFASEFPVEKNIIDKQLAEENAQRLKSVVSNLSARQREIIYLKFYQQLDHGQIAALMNISQQSVYNLLHETIQKLKKCWQSELLMTVS